MEISTRVEIRHKSNAMELTEHEYNPFYATYISLVGDLDLIQGLTDQKKTTLQLLESISEENFNHAYALNKWTVKEVTQHIIDNERIFCARALRIARNDTLNLPGYNQEEYTPFFDANRRSKADLLSDYMACRNNSISLFKSFTQEMLLRIGSVSNSKMSTRAAGAIIIGHETHHVNVIKERYLKPFV